MRQIPAWVWGIVFFLAAIEPATHVWIQYFPPEGGVPTGIHTQDDPFWLTAMDMFPTGFTSPYATCQSPHGEQYSGYFYYPWAWLYGVIGAVGWLLGADSFLFLGISNGLGMLAYLLAVYAFLRVALPRLANRSFLLFTLSGGLGGVLFVLTGLLGLHDAAQFDEHFRRYAVFELMEGVYLAPHLHANRLYYTLPLAMGFAALALLIRRLRGEAGLGAAAVSFVLIYLACFFNQRIAPMFWLIGAIYAIERVAPPPRVLLREGAWWTLAILLAFVHSWTMLNPEFKQTNYTYTAGSIWISAFLSAAFLYQAVLPFEIGRSLSHMSRLGRFCGCAAVGYVGVFLVLYALYQVYWGNLTVMRDAVVAMRISDWALSGAVLGGAYAVLRPARPKAPDWLAQETGWAGLWFLALFAVGISAFFNGAFLRFSPMKMLVLLGLPLCIVTAAGIERLQARHRKLAFGLQGALLFCGVTSIVVAALFFQGTLWREPGGGPMRWTHSEMMTRADANTLAHLGEGRVLAPFSIPLFGDVAVEKYGARAVFGEGTATFSGLLLQPFREQVEAFYRAGATEAFREQFVREWCVEYLYCPDTDPVDEAVIAELYAAPWLEVVASEGKAVLFAVGER